MIPDGILELIDCLLDAEGDSAAWERLQAWLREDAAHLDLFVQQTFFHVQLRESLVSQDVAELAGPLGQLLEDGNLKPIVFPTETTFGSGNSWTRLFLLFLVLSTFASAIAGVSYYLGRNHAPVEHLVFQQPQTDGPAIENAAYIARLVKVTNCLWDSTRSTASLKRDSQISPGQSLNLLEGVAEINSVLTDGTVGKFILEGPVSLMLTSQGVPSLQYGKLSVSVNGENDFFALETALGYVVASKDASFGILSNANMVEVHVFAGSATFKPLQLFSAGSANEPLKVLAGSSLRLSLSPERSIAVQHGSANEEAFITQASMNASHLNITDKYVATIKAAKPIAYWRFDRVENDVVPNEMGDNYSCRIQGSVSWRTYPSGNRSVEFGFTSQSGLLLSDESLDRVLKDNYTIEFWVKPSYCHLGSVFSLVKCKADNTAVPLHGVLIELVGPATDPSFDVSQVDRVRFLHRNPPSMLPHSGTSCYSTFGYEPRVWQYVAAVKDKTSMKLYVDGKLAAEAKDTTPAPKGLRVLMGQLYSLSTGPNAATRPFVGELDEVALYDRPLAPAEINNHIALAHISSTDGNSW